jgi:thioesterase domain-containing protein
VQLPFSPAFDTRGYRESADGALVCLRPGVSKPALFCVHAGSGHLRLYDNLVARLPSDRPVYGLRATPHHGSPESADRRLSDLAGRYAREMLDLQPDGRYVIVGECDGGALAFELAHQLRASGKDVPLLALVDSFGPGGPRLRVPRAAYRAADALRMLGFHLATVARLPSHRRMEYVRTRVIRAMAKITRKASAVRGTASGEAARQEAFRTALDEYEPVPYGGRVLLLRGAQLPWGVEGEADLGWAEIAPQLEMVVLPGYFGTNMLEPHVRLVADRLEQAVRAATAG